MTDTDSVSGPGPTRALLLGAGQLGSDLVAALQRLGAQVVVAEAAAGPGVDEVVALTDADELAAAISRLRPDVVVPATDAVSVTALRLAGQAGTVQVVPSARSVRLAADREELRHLVAEDIGVPTVPFWFAGSARELAEVTERAGYPLVVSPVGVGRPGDGQSVLVRPDDIEPAWRRAVAADGHSGRVLAESVIQTDYEITQLVVVTDEDDVQFCAPIGRRPTADGRGLECWQPQPMSTVALDAARSVAGRIVRALGGRGLFGIELAVRDDEVFFRDASVFPADAGLVTLRTQRLSQFELAARAVLGLPADTVLISPGAARLLYTEVAGVPAAALKEPETDVRVFGPGARSAVALATAGDAAAALARVEQAAAALTGVAHR